MKDVFEIEYIVFAVWLIQIIEMLLSIYSNWHSCKKKSNVIYSEMQNRPSNFIQINNIYNTNIEEKIVYNINDSLNNTLIENKNAQNAQINAYNNKPRQNRNSRRNSNIKKTFYSKFLKISSAA